MLAMAHSTRPRRGKRQLSKHQQDQYRILRERKEADRRALDDQVKAQQQPFRRPDTKVHIVQGSPTATPVELLQWGPHNYDKYINSVIWARRKKRYFSTHPRRCRWCRRGVREDEQIHLHHLSYEHMGDEPDEDLMALCQTHHTMVHETHRLKGGDLRSETIALIEAGGLAVQRRRRASQK